MQDNWASELTTFDRDLLMKQIQGHVAKHLAKQGITLPDDPATWIETINVPTLTAMELVSRFGQGGPDVIAVDTEGYDKEILDSIDFFKVGTRLVLFEHIHLDESAQHQLTEKLHAAGFDLYRDRMDTIALRNVHVPRIAIPRIPN